MRILAIGECMVELAPLPESGTFRMGFAGDTFNTAWYLRRHLPADWRVDYLTAVGTDAVSGRMVGMFRDAGIGTDHVARLPDRTVGLYLIELANGERSFSYWRGQSAARALAADPGRLSTALKGATLAYLSGITLAILPEEDRARLLAALSEFRAAGGLVAFDPNLRPRLWPSPQAMTRAVMQAAEVSDIALPSFEDEATFFADTDPAATLWRYQRAGAATVIVKNGSGTILAADADASCTHVPAPAADVVDTTAAGDSFNAGFLAARLTGASLAAAIESGARLAVRVIAARGALVET